MRALSLFDEPRLRARFFVPCMYNNKVVEILITCIWPLSPKIISIIQNLLLVANRSWRKPKRLFVLKVDTSKGLRLCRKAFHPLHPQAHQFPSQIQRPPYLTLLQCQSWSILMSSSSISHLVFVDVLSLFKEVPEDMVVVILGSFLHTQSGWVVRSVLVQSNILFRTNIFVELCMGTNFSC